jgi:LacI family transcriptional regulator
MRELHYVPTHAARTLKRKQTDTIGVIFPDIANGYFAEVLRGIHRVTRERKRQLQLTFYDCDEVSVEVLQRGMLERRADAVIFFCPSCAVKALRGLDDSPLPVVLLGAPAKGHRLHAVELDNAGGVKLVLDHLLAEGCTDIAVLSGPPGGYDTDRRLDAARAFLRERGIGLPKARIWEAGYTLASGRQAVAAFLRSGQPLPDAVFGLNDAMALGALQALQEHGVAVPDRVAVAGFDDTDVAHYAGLTTAHIPTEELGSQACELALRALEAEQPLRAAERRLLIPVELVMRGSSRRKKKQ